MKRFRESKTLKWLCLIESATLFMIFFFYTMYPNAEEGSGKVGFTSEIKTRAPESNVPFQNIPVPPGYSLESQLASISPSLVLSKLFQGSMSEFELAPYFWRANRQFDQNSITITTMITEERINRLEMLVQSYSGLLSVTFHLVLSHPNASEVFHRLSLFYNSNPEVRDRVDLHVLRDAYPRQFNLWRNIARFFARSRYILNIDADFRPSKRIKEISLLAPSKIYIVPAFELAPKVEIPESKEQLRQLWKQGKAMQFHAQFTPGHNATMYETWFSSDKPYRVAKYHLSYEPYWIMERNQDVWCEERFVGYGANKAACVFEMYTAGLDLIVLPDVFLVHMDHPYPETRKIERVYNRQLYDNYRIEMCVKYKRKRDPTNIDSLMLFQSACAMETARKVSKKPMKKVQKIETKEHGSEEDPMAGEEENKDSFNDEEEEDDGEFQVFEE